MRSLVEVNGFSIPDPSEYSGTTATLVDSARNAEGIVVGAVIREDVSKVEMKWNFIAADTWAYILQQFSTTSGGQFYNNVTFFNQDTNGWTTRKMYVSDRTASIYVRNPDGSIKGYTDARIALIEV